MKERAMHALESVGLADRAMHIPSQLSGGEQQRIALARALINDPRVILADEPTGNLDFDSGQELMRLLVELNNQGKTILMVTHDLEYLTFAKTAVHMFNGEIKAEYTDHKLQALLKEIKTKRGTEVKNI